MVEDLGGLTDERLQGRAVSAAPSRTSVQESIYRSLIELNPDLAALYEGARQMLTSNDPLEGWPHFVSHAVREISTRVPDLVRGAAGARGPDANTHMNQIARAWERHGLPIEAVEVPLEGDPGQPPTLAVEIPHGAVKIITNAIREHSTRESMSTKLRDAARMRARGADKAWLDRWADEWTRSHNWAVGHAHARLAPMEVSLEDYREEFRRFEATIAGLLGDIVTNKEGLNAVLAEANRRTD